MKRLSRIGIFGGSFDPPHMGHLIIAELVRQQLALDRVVFVPAFTPPHKKGNHASTAFDRLHMTRLAVRGNPHFSVSDLEVRREGISYTVDSLRVFKRRHPHARLYLIIGSDTLGQFWQWKSPREILSLATPAVYSRPGFERARAPRGRPLARIKGPLLQISSTQIRKRIAAKKSVRYLVPDAVRQLILRRNLYSRSRI
ncbi:MAG: nicotinate-nucleotide adenylyltransferase [Ignavibacteria bacterium]|nr:nicotinate-nucleotide adenylyltransferase [Ignavibacteria bacterium]